MNKNTKKKVLSLALIIALLAIAVVGGSLAWFSDTDEATNTFTVGSIVIEQLEQQPVLDENGKPTTELEDFEQNKVLLPVVNTEKPSEDPNYQYKMVSVKNNGNNAAYIRTFIAVPADLEPEYLKLDIVGEGWTELWNWPEFEYEVAENKKENYVVKCFVHMDPLAPGATTGTLLKGVYLDAPVDIKDNPATESANLEFCLGNNDNRTFSGYEIADKDGKILHSVDVLVLTEAVQQEGFADAMGALNAAFGKLEDGHNPFLVTTP